MHNFRALTLLIMMSSSLVAQEVGKDKAVAIFETKIRPVLVERCLECHSVETEKSGGLLLDSAAGWQAGGETGTAIQPGKASESLLWRAISYEDPRIQMPPDGKLPDESIEAFRDWINAGAFDPRDKDSAGLQPSKTGLPVEDAQKHWSYRSLPEVNKLEISLDRPAGDGVDYWIDQQLEASGIKAAERAEAKVLVRRLFYDLWGLPPTPGQLADWSADLTPARYEQLVDQLLASPHFGETVARRWMDVVRYADSVTLRGFVLPQAWRYRDYLIDAFNEDRSFQMMIQQQVAGDLLSAENPAERSQQLVATTFLALGNTNLEEQDKDQLDMDYIDEQLDVIGAAFLGQTIGCARCHDHKFDPIPTRDYYALAGILKSSKGMKHDNVSQWLEQPLPLEADEQSNYEQMEQAHKKFAKEIQNLKKKLDDFASKNPRFIQPEELPGIVVDSSKATLVGNWVKSTHVGNIVGENYLHDENSEKGRKSATFEPATLPPGEYEVLLAYQASENRASNVVVKIFSASGEAEVKVDQRQPATELNLWHSLGRYRFEGDGQKYVLVGNDGTDGHVIVDAVLFLPISELKNGSLSTTLQPTKSVKQGSQELSTELKELEKKAGDIQKQLNERPKFLTVVESSPPTDIPIHIRGDVHRLGEVVPRGFLTAVPADPRLNISAPDRLAMATWLSADSNPLTARVYANRIWLWLMGQGIVATPNNFGTTGTPPTHPQLLDWLALKLIHLNWSTKALMREIVMSRAYQRAVVDPCLTAKQADIDNQLYWRGQVRRLPAESLRDAMLLISGELDRTRGGSLIRAGVKADYNYEHNSTRRSIYQPVFRNSLPALFEEFDFGNPSLSIDNRPRSTVAPQGLALMNDPWVNARAKQASQLYASLINSQGLEAGLNDLYLACYARLPNPDELRLLYDYLSLESVEADRPFDVKRVEPKVIEQLIQSLFAAVDFRFLD